MTRGVDALPLCRSRVRRISCRKWRQPKSGRQHHHALHRSVYPVPDHRSFRSSYYLLWHTAEHFGRPGTLTNGTKFDSSVDRGQPFQCQIGVGQVTQTVRPDGFSVAEPQVIKGWDEGVLKMKVGSKGVLNITSDYGYGARGIFARLTFQPHLF